MNEPISVAYSTWSTLVTANPTWSQRWTSDGGAGYFLVAGHPDFVVRCSVFSAADIADFELNHKANGVSSPSSDDAFALIVAVSAAVTATAGGVPGGGVSLYGTDGAVSRAVKVRDNGALRAESIPYLTQITTGNVPGHTAFSQTTSGVVVSDIEDGESALFVLGDWNEQSAAAQWSISSDDASDAIAGTGAHKVKVTYLDSARLLQTEVVSLNGTTPVNFVATDMLLIDAVEVIQCGSSGANKGTLSIHSATAGGGQVVAQVLPGRNSGNWAVIYAPSNKTTWVAYVVSASSDKNIVFENRHTVDFTDDGGGTVATARHFDVSGRGGESSLLATPRAIFPGEKLEWWAMADKPGNIGYLTVYGWRE